MAGRRAGKSRGPEAPEPVRVLLFATARTAVGEARVAWPVAAHGASLAEVVADLGRTYPRLKRVLPHSRLFLNGTLVRGTAAALRPGDELAIHPPYGGG